jgi:DNA polymerase elongation subunit (family B)
MKLVNLHNHGRAIYKFLREGAELKVIVDNSYYPYYFEPDETGGYRGYISGTYRKVFAPEPKDIRRQASPYALGVDIPYTKNYMLDKIKNLTKTHIKIGFVDIEVKTDTIPLPGVYTAPISAISLFDYDTKKTHCWFVGDLSGTMPQKESIVIDSFCAKMRELKFDVILMWNSTNFDLPYLTGRDKHWANKASIVNESRYAYRTDNGEYIHLPVGTSFLDYMELFKKYTLNKWISYSLDSVLTQEFGVGKEYDDVDFSKISEEVKLRNMADVQDMAKLEDKYHLVEYFDVIRRKIHCDWEDLPSRTTRKFNKPMWNSNNTRIIDTLILKKAKEMSVILPNKPKGDVDIEYDGAERNAFETGVFTDVHKVDLDSDYPRKLVDFCLDTTNFLTAFEEGCTTINISDRETGAFRYSYYVKKNPNAILPSVMKDLLDWKLEIKQEKKNCKPDSPEWNEVNIKYAASKAILNSGYGSTGNKFFRLFDLKVAESVTFLARDLLYFLKSKIEENKCKLLYVDTDGLMIQGSANIVKVLNQSLKEWGDKYSINVTDKLDFEGTYKSIFILAKCRYYGRLEKSGEIQEDKCGIEALRNDASEYTKEFQVNLFNKILDCKSRSDIMAWVIKCRKDITKEPLYRVSKPVKVHDKEYKTEKLQNNKVVNMPPPPQVRALENATKYNIEEIKFGERFYLINMLPFGEENTGHPATHLGFKNNEHKIDRSLIDWDKVIELNIDNKVERIFEILKWDYDVSGQKELVFN